MRYVSARAAVVLSLAAGPAVALSLVAGPAVAVTGGAHVITVTTTIQAAVDRARPGDTVVVPPGAYHENVVLGTPGVTLTGSLAAVLDGTGQPGAVGLTVRAADGGRLAGFTLRGLTVRGFRFAGVLADGVDNLRLTGTSYVDDGEYGLFPIRSAGRVDHNTVTGADDTGLYIGQSHDLLVADNIAYGNTVGIEVELSTAIRVEHNLATGNSVGVLVQVLPRLPATVTDDVQVTGNRLVDNARPNDVTDPRELLSALPSGIGLLDVGGDGLTVTANTITGNPTAGIGVVSLPAALAALDPRIDPAPDRVTVAGNVVRHNGFAADPKIAPLQPADIVWDGTGQHDCFTASRSTTFPPVVTAC